MMSTLPCEACLRRSRLMARLGPRLDVRRLGPDGLAALLALPEGDLVRALCAEQAEVMVAKSPAAHPPEGAGTGEERIALCRHDPRWPLAETNTTRRPAGEAWGAPAVLYVAGHAASLRGIGHSRAVAVAGARRSTDYGCEVARALARELAHAGLTVMSGLGEGVAAAAHTGVLEAGGTPVALLTGGADVCQPVACRGLYADIVANGCAVSEVPWGERPRRWCYAGRSRLLAGLAALVVVVEAENRPSDLSLARFARELGRAVAAVPGRVTSPASDGAHALIAEGVPLVRDGADALDVLLGGPAGRDPRHPDERHGGGRGRAQGGRARGSGDRSPQHPVEGTRSGAVLDAVRSGADTAARLARIGFRIDEALACLAELEIMGAVARGDGGRYLPRMGVPAAGPGTALGL
jgi:DNA processing protein